jgi:RecB family exonuclease
MKQHISFSELKNWDFCPYYHKLVHIDGIAGFTGNIYTAFGSAIHDVCEKLVLKEAHQSDAEKLFEKNFKKELDSLENDDYIIDAAEMLKQGKKLAQLALPALQAKFAGFEVVSAEELLYEPIEDSKLKFKGYVDLVIRTADGKVAIIDWKTCSWGWDSRKKSDPMVFYQLILYKHFLCKKLNLEPADVEVYFGLLKRTAKKNEVEFLRMTSGKRRTKNCLDFLEKALYNIENKNFVKNRMKCQNCEFNLKDICNKRRNGKQN